ncbi:ornithine cyclodeaminase [Kerstersia gyiorum]|uniref:ornithine cyclodeaminase n=1 Tax=Kerstersia gyiorum TaxID=206506 RepID=UPI00209FE1A1|nr:ornithine cyclodeaminase [Kerstersia gyiorum]MCP1670863.1 ornithine cyclodeaminase [Kerstersia gyiorum]MCP1708795.1 ornithine cyclodeaminase [Kerstersia gyiorum]
MTTFLATEDVVALTRRLGIEQTLRQMEAYIKADFLRWEAFDKTARVASHSDIGVIELMPAADHELYAFKYVNGHPSNPQVELPTVMAFGALAEVSTGKPLLLSELTLTTALRTAATSALAARVLARPQARVMALIGNGSQSEFQALAFHYLLGIDTIRLYDVDPGATAKLRLNLAQVPGLTLVACASAAEASQGADIVTTVTADKTNAIILDASMIEPGMHINAVGGDCPGKTELAADILLGATTFVEFEPQSRIEGEIQQMPADYTVQPLWEVLAGKRAGRSRTDEITVFDSVGFALEDYAALRFLHDQAQAHGLGVKLEVVPDLADPKNLFGEALGAASASAAPAGALAA